MNEQTPHEEQNPDNWTLLRDVAVLQVKLLVDGLRDLVLVPASLIAGLISLLSASDGRPGPYFYRAGSTCSALSGTLRKAGARTGASPAATSMK